jgi:hypothetical protein
MRFPSLDGPERLVGVCDSSGLMNSGWALAKALARVGTDSMDRRMGNLRRQVEAHGARFEHLARSPGRSLSCRPPASGPGVTLARSSSRRPLGVMRNRTKETPRTNSRPP